MSANASERANPLYITAALLFFVWLAGAFVGGMYHNYAQKRDCIQAEGWLKGWLWCSTETGYSFTANMLRGAIWPLDLTTWLRSDPNGSSSVDVISTAEASPLANPVNTAGSDVSSECESAGFVVSMATGAILLAISKEGDKAAGEAKLLMQHMTVVMALSCIWNVWSGCFLRHEGKRWAWSFLHQTNY